ncbi:MAG TPA: tRNA (cytidine(56)-2'-O)-methyltransferase [Candidatus Thermoplasmatota archaeon]|nr:tRNA (cytidine(56)-2'-O)-methyltransferase [Candidatus Thermoplasmatota archaeon]
MIWVLRLGHRPVRDARITTHVCLVARAFGADRVLLTTRDASVVDSVRDVTRRFGGPFEIEAGVSWREVVRTFPGTVVHLTMYGEPFEQAVPALRGKDVLVVVGAEKVPGELYAKANRNLAVGHQPHSEVAALAVLLHTLRPEGLHKRFFGEIEVKPSARGKRVVPAGGETSNAEPSE